MTTVARREPTSPSFEVSNSIPIAHLSPSSVQTSSYIAANVALVWPYSSATGNLALLLAEPDVRLRKHKGQVKVVFRDGCAREIAKTRVGIGDTVKLALAGCEWKETGDAVSTPGKKIDWDLEFRGQVIFQVVRENGHTSTVTYTAPESNFPAQNGIPGPTDSLQTPRVSMNSVLPYGQSTIRVQLTPFKTARKSAGGTFVDASLDPFADDDGYVLGKGRKRTKFARHSGSWSLVDSDAAREPEFASQASPSDVVPTSTSLAAQQPEHDAATVEPDHAEHERESPREPDDTESVPTESIDAPTVAQPVEQTSDSFHSPVAPNESAKGHISAPKVVMGPPLTPLRIAPQSIPANADALSEERFERTSTPRLQPLASPGLPLVSPLIRRSGPEVGYFPPSATGLSQLDASGGGKGQLQSLENNILSDGPVLEQFGDIQYSSKDEQHVPLNSASEVSLTTDNRNGPEQDTKTHSSGSVQSVEFSTIPQVPGSPQEAPRSSRSPSPNAAKQHQEPLLSDKSPSLSPNALAILVEGEDEDMYGPPKEISTASSQVVNSTSHEQAQSCSDNAEQSFSSPATNHALQLAGEFGQDVAQSPVLRQASAQEHVTAAWKEQITVGAVECQSPGTYPAPPFPFKQNWHKRRESYSSSRRSSYHSQTHSLDGNVDERADLSTERDSPENSTSQLVDLGAARVEIPSISSKSGSPTLSSPTAPAPEESQRIPQDNPSETSAMPASAGGHHYVQPYVEEVPEGAPTPQAFTAPDGGEQPHESPTPQKAQHTYNPPGEPVQVTSAQQQPPAPSKAEAIQEQKVQGQLPTPDQTQEDREEEEEDPAINMEFAQGFEHQTAPFAPRSPEISQGPAKTPDEQDAQAQLNAATATPATPTQVSVTQAESTHMRRTSQRLFVKKSVVAVNVSSPYFSPRNGVVAPSSPLFVQEGPSATESDLNNSSSSQLEQRTQTGATSLTVRETDEDRADTGASTRAKEPEAGLQPRKGTLTPLSYYAHLISLDEHFGKLVDVIAICAKKSADPQRSKSGPKDYHTTLHIADPSSLDSDSSESGSSTVVQIFRPVKTSLPTTDRGDAIMLRNFKVQTLNHKFMLLSSETSSWAVLKAPQGFGSTFSDIVVSGPPIEYGLDETACADSLFRWWETGGQAHFPAADHSQDAPHDENNGRKKSPDVHVPRTPAPPSRSKEQQHRESAPRHSRPSPLPAATTSRRKDNYTDNVNNEDENENEGDWRNTAVVLEDEDEAEEEVVLDKHDANPPPTTTSSSPSRQRGRRASTVSMAPSTSSAREAAGRETPTPRRSARNRASPILVHELRDGTKYVDHNRRRSGSVVHELRDGVTYVDE